jgi:hypothetical protein
MKHLRNYHTIKELYLRKKVPLSGFMGKERFDVRKPVFEIGLCELNVN